VWASQIGSLSCDVIEGGMKKEELDQLPGNEPGDLDLGAIEEHLHALASERRLPVTALELCAARIEESAPALRAVLERAADGEALTEQERMLLFRGLYVLGQARDKQSYPTLLRLLRRPTSELNDLGDLITEGLARIVAGVFDGDSEAMFELICDSSTDEYVRNALFCAAAFLTWKGLIARERMEGLLVKFYEGRMAEDQDHAWVGWVDAISLLGLRHLAPTVYRAWDEGRVPNWVLNRSNFEQDLVEAEQRPDDVKRFENANVGYLEDIAEALSWSDRPETDEDPDKRRDRLADQPPFKASGWIPSEPVRNPMRHVGRNDPCPCGSGKKAKKCCLARQD
jgi:hypothetical protein